ncbi:GATA transcription factor [Parasponia andersonii]|uniref:GATA transcription factor n=1 Tax=Parasponia andersonii TaxID=3476 RepID=A0A2P5D3G2_PARAD|nr:GATA transcription factor [Parasponia andersonii]
MEAPELHNYINNHQNNNVKTAMAAGGDHFAVEDLLDFSNEDVDAIATVDGAFNSSALTAGNSTDSNSTQSTTHVLDTSCNSSSFSGCKPNGILPDHFGSRDFPDAHFSSDLCVPYDDLAELEWLSNFVEESFSSEDLQKLHLISGIKARGPDESSDTTTRTQPNRAAAPIFNPDVSVPAKARSKRSRAPPCNWTSRLLHLSPTTSSSHPPPPPPQYEHVVVVSVPHAPASTSTAKKAVKAGPPKKKEAPDNGGPGAGEGRRCQHCATDKTPQWRTGPMGPKTLCNACGVRYKSGRLVPEYRPAASPTFVLTKHSNSHRKVLELRRQKEMLRSGVSQHQQQPQFLPHHHHHHHHQSMMFDASNGEDYLIHQHVGPDYRQMI